MNKEQTNRPAAGRKHPGGTASNPQGTAARPGLAKAGCPVMSKNRIKFCTIRTEILYRQDLRPAEKIFLGLVWSFRKDGLHIFNRDLGEILGLNPSNTSRLIAKFQAAGWIKITGEQSKHRHIYFASGGNVESNLLCSFGASTLPPRARNLASVGKQVVNSNKSKEGKTVFTLPLADVETPEHKTTPAKTPDPAKLARVFADLGFDAPESEAV